MTDVDRGWLDEAQEEINKYRQIHGGKSHTQKKINTILALVDAKLAGMPIDSVFKRPECGSRVIYYTKWKDDEDFTVCLTAVLEIAQRWHDGRAVRAIEEASTDLALLTRVATKVAAQAMKPSHPIDIRLRAAFGVLDRAGLRTAVKTQHQMLGDNSGLSEMEDDELDLVLANLLMAAGIHDGGEDDASD